MDALLSIRDFTQQYNDYDIVVDSINLEVGAGEIFGIIGHNGAGKSTTIKSIVGILPVEKGEILIDGKSIGKNRKECQKMLAYVPDNPDIYGYMTGIEYINYIADLYEVPQENRNAKIKELSDAFAITEHLGNLISSYSHGMRQKVALIAAFAHEPKLLILDEPFVGLDPFAINVLKKTMRSFCDRGNAIFYSTHVLDVAERLCDKVAILDHGKIVACGDTKEVMGDKSLEEVFLDVVSQE